MHNAFEQQSMPPPDPRVVMRQAVATWKNVFLLLLLAIAMISLVAGLNCDAATDDAGACATLLSAFTARQLTYAGAALTFGFCCCPCFRLDCDADELRKRSCFLQAVERRAAVVGDGVEERLQRADARVPALVVERVRKALDADARCARRQPRIGGGEERNDHPAERVAKGADAAAVGVGARLEVVEHARAVVHAVVQEGVEVRRRRRLGVVARLGALRSIRVAADFDLEDLQAEPRVRQEERVKHLSRKILIKRKQRKTRREEK